MIYRALALLFKDREFDGNAESLGKIFISHAGFNMAMDFCGEENSLSITAHVLLGLAKESLAGPDLASGPVEMLRDTCLAATEPGLVARPTLQGLDLFLWAHGQSSSYLNDFFKAASGFPDLAELRLEVNQFRVCTTMP